jgi:transglutaminase-like putative cysteine protease
VIYQLRHRTTYSYEAPVTFARCVLRLRPQSSSRQTVSDSVITLSPAASQQIERQGPFGEDTLTVVIDTPHKELVIEASAQVEVHAPQPTLFADSPPWEIIRARALESNDLGPQGPAAYLYPTERTPDASAITDYVRTSFTAGRPINEATAALMVRLNADFKFDPRATDAYTPPLDAFIARRGVCQDFAQIMISGLRGLGLPAAYVSGYLRTFPPPGRKRLQGSDASHAWVDVWSGSELGWSGFDPTNAVLAQDDHIVLARGRDYGDACPIEGIILAPGVQTLDVEVDVIPQDELVGAA